MKEHNPPIIDTRLPLQTNNGHPVIITHTYEEPEEERWKMVGIIKKGSWNYLWEQWDELGNPKSGKSDRQLQNVPGCQCTEVFLNIHQSGTTGYGYRTREMAEKYAIADSNGEKIVATVKQRITYKKNKQHGSE